MEVTKQVNIWQNVSVLNSTLIISVLQESVGERIADNPSSLLSIAMTGCILGSVLLFVSCILFVVCVNSNFGTSSVRLLWSMTRCTKVNRIGPETVYLPGSDDDGLYDQTTLNTMSECSIRGFLPMTSSMLSSSDDMTSERCLPVSTRRWTSRIVPLTPGYASAIRDRMSVTELSVANIADMFSVVRESRDQRQAKHSRGKVSEFMQSVVSIHPVITMVTDEHCACWSEATGQGTSVSECEQSAACQGRVSAADKKQQRTSRLHKRGSRTSTWIITDPTNVGNLLQPAKGQNDNIEVLMSIGLEQ